MINATTSHLSSRDKLLFYALLTWFVCVFSLATLVFATGEQYDMRLMVQGSADAQSFPTLDGSPFEEADITWQVGDEVRRIDGIDARGMSTVYAYATLVSQSGDGSLELELSRGGEQFTLNREAARWEFQGASLITALVFSICGAIAFLGAPATYVTRCFFVGVMTLGINSLFFDGFSVEFTLAYVVSYCLASVLLAVYGFKAVAAFPSGKAPTTLYQHIWPWVLAVFLVVPAMSVLINAPFRAESMATMRWVMFSIAGVLAVWLTLRNYRSANSKERAQLKWVLLGTYLMFVPLSFATAIAAFSDEYSSLIRIIDFTNMSYPICWLIAILGYQAFDVDRLFSAVMTYTVSAAIALALIVGLLPNIATDLIEGSALQPELIYTLLSLAVCSALFRLHRALRPRVESLFFPQRLRLESAAQNLSRTLASCESEDQLLDTLVAGLAKLQGVGKAELAANPGNNPHGYELKLQPGVGEGFYIHLGAKPSGDIYSDRDIAVMNRLVAQTETLLLKMRNQALTLQRQAAEQLAAEKSLFLASASHDLRQPMHALGLFSESLVARNHDERLDVLVHQIHRSTRALDSMFNSILDLSKIDAGAMVPELGPVYVQLLFEELELEFAASALDKGLKLTFVPTSAVIFSDANLLARVLRNLISNAIRYTDKGKILVGCRYGRDAVRLQVLDTGRGISTADQQRIFTAYARVDKHIEGGLGLGLSLVDKLCKLLEHPLSVQSAEGQGSLFSITAPITIPVPRSVADRKQITLPQAKSLAGLTVLAIDDDPAIRLGLTELLTAWGCQIQTQDSLESVVEWLSTEPVAVDLVLVDLHLTNRQDGLRILEALFARWGSVPAVLITGDAQSGMYKWVSGKQVAIVNKPLGPEKLKSTMQEAMIRKVAHTAATSPVIQ